ncbi:hypothetical protein A1OE_1103 [Candidatus Endolissoclinum faulkneri L2]|uniref:Uncharacterized protein n=1 Tax=Candidatus Endolissoclinum faulkneri L2 TaxID=1193729 RepID=K7ZD81_9PROT|nr:hypothetical protein A1OE_1103 [Candidatus Endolissoclinum faulkneri L2]
MCLIDDLLIIIILTSESNYYVKKNLITIRLENKQRIKI